MGVVKSINAKLIRSNAGLLKTKRANRKNPKWEREEWQQCTHNKKHEQVAVSDFNAFGNS